MFPFSTRILVVEDLKTIRTLLIDFLKNIGFENIDEAENGNDALSMLKDSVRNKYPYGLIFCDWNMPNFSGIELLNAKNHISNLKDIPFLMVTVENDKDYIIKAVSLGVDDYILKPFDQKTIENKLLGVWLRRSIC